MTHLDGLRRLTLSDRAALERLQQAAYAQNRALLGVEPLPLLADYGEILAGMEAWGVDGPDGLDGALILEWRPEDLLIWSVATAPRARGAGLANRLLAAAETRARAEGRDLIRLYTGQKLTSNVDWYRRRGFAIERTETLPDRVVVHMAKPLPAEPDART